MMKRHVILCLTMVFVAIGCQKVTVDFSYSPTEPKAGESVVFTNNSSAGEKWEWDFGDNSTSTTKNPHKVYKKPGTYLVTLRVDSANNKKCSHSITVYDTIPTFVCSSDSITHYTDVTLTANIYNPFSYTLSYQWSLPASCVLVSGSLTTKSIVVYFTSYGTDEEVRLIIKQGEKKYDVLRSLHIYQTYAPAVLMLLEDGTMMRQRLIGDRQDKVSVDVSDEDRALLAAVCDTLITYNGRSFSTVDLSGMVGKEVKRIQVDKMAQKWYFVAEDGLSVASIDGKNVVSIDTLATGAIYVDNSRNSLYWGTKGGLKVMSLVKSMDNSFSTIPQTLNEEVGIVRIAINNNLR